MTTTLVNTLNAPVPTTFVTNGGWTVSRIAHVGPRIAITEPTTLVEVGGFFGCDGGCAGIEHPFKVVIRRAAARSASGCARA